MQIRKGLMAKEALGGEVMENETTEVVKETSARRRWGLLCWLLTWWIPLIFLKWFSQMKREDVRQAWREKLALNIIIWLPRICGEVFDLTQVAATHQRVITVIPTKTVLQDGSIDASTLFPVLKTCLRNLFLVGMVDNRNSPQCLFSQYVLLVLSIMMVSIITFKFIVSINFGSPHVPENHDKFIICQLNYDDKHKLILIVCDGDIIGSGNDRPTPCIMLDILGANPILDPELLSAPNASSGMPMLVLADMFQAGAEDLGKGSSDINPIQIPQLHSSTFDLFVEHHFGLIQILKG
ncbi:hypothetical protein OG21DRAFT_1491476 [Imleria badia]|nr:hypothetical protein OG21DRAFT_1491476 [Imleria badia]